MESIESLVYVSSAVQRVSDAQLSHLLDRARLRNKRCDVTGLLLYDAGNFMQYIEGPAAGLTEVYEHIRRDSLHTGLIELCREGTHPRAFGNWAMAARVFEPGGQVRNVVSDMDQGFDVNLLRAANGAAGTLLSGFWQRHQRLA
jgi:Sensors of blue-light using FAD